MIQITLPDFDKVVAEVTEEIKVRVALRTPRKTGTAADAWKSEVVDGVGTISNDTPYIDFLETGTSKMAGHFMVQTTLEEVPDLIKAAVERST